MLSHAGDGDTPSVVSNNTSKPDTSTASTKIALSTFFFFEGLLVVIGHHYLHSPLSIEMRSTLLPLWLVVGTRLVKTSQALCVGETSTSSQARALAELIIGLEKFKDSGNVKISSK